MNLRSTLQGALALANVWGHDARLDNANIVRRAMSVAIGLLTTLLLFLLMQALIKSDINPFTDPGQGQVLQFMRLQEEVDIPEDRIRPKPPPPPEEMPPDLPRVDYDKHDTIGREFGPRPDPREDRRLIRPGFEADGEYLPIVKVKPVYPRRAQQRGIEGYVLLEFVVTTSGAVRDPVVIEASPPAIFDQSAIRAALKFKYRPRVANGERMEVSGVRNLIMFRLNDG